MSRRLFASYLVLTLVLLAALEVPLAVNNRLRLRTELTANLVRDAFTMAGYAEQSVEGKGSLDLERLASNYSGRAGGRVVIVTRDGRTLADSQREASSGTFVTRPEITEALAGNVATGTRRSDTLGTNLLYVAVPIATADGVKGALRITYSTAQIDRRRRNYLTMLLGIAVVSLAVAGLLGLVFARWVIRPVRRLEEAAAALGRGDLTTRASDRSGPPEMLELVHAFNLMAARIDELVSSQSAFVANASHQLRTPLQALQLRLENLQADLAQDGANASPTSSAQAGSRKHASEDIDGALTETARLARIVDGLLALARADNHQPATGAEDVAIDDLLVERVTAWAPVAADRGIGLAREPGGFTVVANPDGVSQALDNLIANAIDASPTGGRVLIRTSLTGRGSKRREQPFVEVHVVDEGPGLSADQRVRAFERFWRAGPASSVLGGTGLGLAIARQFARADGGEIELRERPAGGVDAVALFPASHE